MSRIQSMLMVLVFSVSVSAKEYHVAKTGNDENSGALQSPFLSIPAASNIAKPGDVITVYEGVYREGINPPGCGISDYSK